MKQCAFHYDKTCRKPVFPSGWIMLFQPLHLGSLRTATWWRKPNGFQCGDLETSKVGIGKVCLRHRPGRVWSASRRPCESGSLLETPVTPACTTDASWVSRSCQRPSWLLTMPEQATCEKSQRCCDAHVCSLQTHTSAWMVSEGGPPCPSLPPQFLEMPLIGPLLEPENKGGFWF